MKMRTSRVLLFFLLYFADRWIGKVDCNKDYEIGGANETESKTKGGLSKSTAATVTRAIAEVGKTFHYGMIGELNKVTEVNGQKQVGFFMKKVPMIKHIPKLAGFFGGVGTLLFVAFSVIPQGDSAELKYMKEKFGQVNEKLDGISRSVKHTKDLVKEYSQKSVYITAENNILTAYEKLIDGVDALLNVTCSEPEKMCKKRKLKMIDDYIQQLNVRSDVELVMRGATSLNVFSESLIELIAEGSRCDVGKIKNFASGVAVLLAKGGSAAMFYDIVTKNKFDQTAALKHYQKILLDLEKKKEKVIDKCYKNIDTYISYDIRDLGLKLKRKSLLETNKDIVEFLNLRYLWIPFYVVSVKTNSNPLFWSKEPFEGHVNRNENNANSGIKSYILFGSNRHVQNKDLKRKAFRDALETRKLYYESWLQKKYDQSMSKLHDAVSKTEYLYDQLRTSLIVPEYDDIIVGYHENGIVKQFKPSNYNDIKREDLLVYQQCRNSLTCSGSDKPVYIVATIKTDNVYECDKDCSTNGHCYFLPRTKRMGCKCGPNHYGDICNMSISDSKLALDLSKLMDISFKIPSLLDVSLQLQDVQVALQAEIGNIGKAIQAMDKRLTYIFDNLGKEIMTSLDWHGLIAQYGQIVRDLKYYYHILVGKDVCTNLSDLEVKELKCDDQRKSITKEKEALAKVILKPNELQSHLHYLNYLFMGRQDMSLISHRPLLFQAMDKHRNKICTTEYKHTLDKVYKQILLLQFQGYIVWLHSLKFLNQDTSFVVDRYKNLIAKQMSFYESNTCKISIKDSTNFESCINGYYIYSGMKAEVKCKDSFYLINDTSVSLHVSSVVRVSSEFSSTRSSADKIIGTPDDSDGGKSWSPSINQIDRQQFIEVLYRDALFIKDIAIYETMHGGAIYKIEGFNKFKQWKVLWETAKSNLQPLGAKRKFTISLQSITWSTSKLKIWIDPTVSGKAFQIDAIEIKGKPVEGSCTWYNSLSYSPCGCFGEGSSSPNCDINGKCACKDNHYGTKCTDRDCEMNEWSHWSTCPCGPGQSHKRTRSVKLQKKGNGKACGSTQKSKECYHQCVCGHEEWGDFCENKHCLVSEWSDWENCPHQSRPICGYTEARTIYVKRTRRIYRRNEGAGRACPSDLEEQRLCPKPGCLAPRPG